MINNTKSKIKNIENLEVALIVIVQEQNLLKKYKRQQEVVEYAKQKKLHHSMNYLAVVPQNIKIRFFN